VQDAAGSINNFDVKSVHLSNKHSAIETTYLWSGLVFVLGGSTCHSFLGIRYIWESAMTGCLLPNFRIYTCA
jgi:hypothetical protein